MSELKSYINRVLGNSLRCLLPSYWWKRLFGLVVDRIDEVESTLSTSIEDAKKGMEIPILESEEELENLDVPIGKLATVIGKGRSFRECYWPTEFPENGGDIFPLLTHILNINVLDGPITSTIIVALEARNNVGISKIIQLVVDNDQQLVGAVDGVTSRVYILSRNGQVFADALQEFNDLLASDVYRYIGRDGNDNLTEDEFDILDNVIRWDTSSEAYIKGGSWERLAKERDLEGIGGGEANADGSVVFYAPVLGDLTEEQKQKNREAYQKVIDTNGLINVKVNMVFMIAEPDAVAFDGSQNLLLVIAGGTTSTGYIVSPDGNLTVETVETPDANSGLEIRELHISQLKQLGQITQETQLTNEQKAYNLETLNLVRQNKAIASVSINMVSNLLHLYVKEVGYFYGCVPDMTDGQMTGVGGMVGARIDEQGNGFVETIQGNSDDELSETSVNSVQNKVVTAALKDKVDKVDGKQLSTEDFTSILKAKLEGLNNYDDTSIRNAINSLTTQINTLVSGDASVAIESFNEIIAFLNGIEDSQGLDSIIASIEQQIAGKQNTIDDLADIREGAALGKTALQEHQDISHLATKEELTNLTNEMVANEEVHAAAYNDLDSRLKDIGSLISGVAVTKEEFQEGLQSITDEIVANEEVHAAAYSDLNSRLAALEAALSSINQ